MRQISGTHFFKAFSGGLSRAFKHQRPSSNNHVTESAKPVVAAHSGFPSQTSASVPAISTPRQWLRELDWDKLVAINQAQCQLQNTQTTPNPKSYGQVRDTWNGRVTESMSLQEALDLCKQCQDKVPFIFSNTSTFSLVVKELLKEVIQGLPTLEAHIVQNTAAGYVTDKVSKKELADILRYYETQWALAGKTSRNGTGEHPPSQAHA